MRILIAFLLLILALQAPAQRKHALLIGIGSYNKAKTKWAPLASVRDVTALRETLIGSQKFEPKDIYLLTDSQATREGIIRALEKLHGVVQANDIVLIHISGHGIQLQDDENRDEIDRLDEAIVPIDAVAPDGYMDPNYAVKEKKYLRDDKFGEHIQKIRSKLKANGSIILTLDMCHSGTAHKGNDSDEAVARGMSVPLVSTSFAAPPLTGENLKGFRDSEAGAENESDLATYVVISAGRAEQSVYQVQVDNGWMGPLSYALCKAFESLPENSTYRSFFSQIESTMLSISMRQHPVMEGNGMDMQLWSNRYEKPRPFFKISTKTGNRVIKTDSVQLEGGLFTGLEKGARVELYAPGGKPGVDTALATGVVTRSTPFTADVKLNRVLNKKPADVWVYLTQPVYNIKPVVLAFGRSNSAVKPGMQQNRYADAEIARIKRELSDLKVVQYSGTPELRLVKGNSKDSLVVVAEDSVFALVTEQTIGDVMKRYIRYKFLRELQVRDTTLNVEVSLLPLKNGKPVFEDAGTIARGLTVYVGDSAVVMVKNRSRNRVYINILDLQPDGYINPIFPNTGITPEELHVNPRDSVVFDAVKNPALVIRWGPPCGTEIFKVFVSREKIDLPNLATQGSKDFKKAMEAMYAELETAGSKSGNSNVMISNEGSVFNIQFRIADRTEKK